MTAIVADPRVRRPVSAMRVFAPGALVSLLFLTAGAEPGVLVSWVMPVVWAAVVDARSSRLPDRVVVPGLAVFMAVLVASVPLTGSSSLLVSGLVGAALLSVPLGLLHLLSPEGLGFGDVKYGVLIGAGVGAATRPGAAVAVFALAMVVQLVVVWWRPLPAQRVPGASRRAAPLGPALALAAVGWVVVSLISEGGV